MLVACGFEVCDFGLVMFGSRVFGPGFVRYVLQAELGISTLLNISACRGNIIVLARSVELGSPTKDLCLLEAPQTLEHKPSKFSKIVSGG